MRTSGEYNGIQYKLIGFKLDKFAYEYKLYTLAIVLTVYADSMKELKQEIDKVNRGLNVRD